MNSKHLQNWVPEVQGQGWRAIVLQIAAATLVSGAIVYFATNPQELAQASARAVGVIHPTTAAALPALPPAAVTEPVMFTNPFDTTEVFEFPSGTSETEARQSVADVLTQRARDRAHIWSRGGHPARAPRRDDPST